MLRKLNPNSVDELSLRFTLALVHAITYDIACEYYANIVKRFKESPHLRDVADLVERAHWGIPALHVTGHKPDCTYLFGTCYMECVGRFHGETAEHY
jgi:hypothetical protein